jgi:hypothetical protein
MFGQANGSNWENLKAKDRQDARRVFVDQAVRETLASMRTPSTAPGGADGER